MCGMGETLFASARRTRKQPFGGGLGVRFPGSLTAFLIQRFEVASFLTVKTAGGVEGPNGANGISVMERGIDDNSEM